MFFHAEERWFPGLNRVAFGAFAFFRAIRKLAFVRFGFVAIGAICERYGLLEIAIYVAGNAGDLRVFAEQREFCF